MKYRNWVYVLVIAGIVLTGVYLVTANTGSSKNYDSFAKCLSNNSKMYGTDWCSYCKKQKKLFGDSFEFVNYINCEIKKNVCDEANIGGYPTWEIKGKLYPGVHTLKEISEISGCSLSD